jgi:hypothetical protein
MAERMERVEEEQQSRSQPQPHDADPLTAPLLPSYALSGGLFYVHGMLLFICINTLDCVPHWSCWDSAVTSCDVYPSTQEQQQQQQQHTSHHAVSLNGNGQGGGAGRQAYCVLSVARQQVRTDNVPIEKNTAEWMFATTFDVISGQAQEFTISVWISAPSEEPALQLVGTWSIDLKNIHPSIFEERDIVLQRPAASLAPPDVQPRIRLQTQLTKHQSHVTEDDFEKLRLIGRGSFGKVFQVRKKVRSTGSISHLCCFFFIILNASLPRTSLTLITAGHGQGVRHESPLQGPRHQEQRCQTHHGRKSCFEEYEPSVYCESQLRVPDNNASVHGD